MIIAPEAPEDLVTLPTWLIHRDMEGGEAHNGTGHAKQTKVPYMRRYSEHF